jgi:hypothetical protein
MFIFSIFFLQEVQDARNFYECVLRGKGVRVPENAPFTKLVSLFGASGGRAR